MSLIYKSTTQNKRLELATTLVCYHRMYSFSFSEIKLLFVTLHLENNCFFQNKFLLPLQLKTIAFSKIKLLKYPKKRLICSSAHISR